MPKDSMVKHHESLLDFFAVDCVVLGDGDAIFAICFYCFTLLTLINNSQSTQNDLFKKQKWETMLTNST